MSVGNENHAVEIIKYEHLYQPDFFRLNKLWIEKDFPLEEIDILVLSKPEEYIINPGGAILLARLGEKIVGTCALKKTSAALLELTKMAVDENYRGRKIGELLGKATIEKAKKMGATKVELYSNRVTSAIAVKLYFKLGFKEVELTPGIYKRANIKMEIEI
ncbi:MAG: GNAT family N-acetyltransferase [Bacteroidia bacterium]